MRRYGAIRELTAANGGQQQPPLFQPLSHFLEHALGQLMLPEQVAETQERALIPFSDRDSGSCGAQHFCATASSFQSSASAPSDPQRARSDSAHGGSSRAMVRRAVRSPSSRVGW